MELYVQYKDYNWMMRFTEQLLEKIAIAVNGSTKVQIGDHEVDFKAPYRRLPILDAIKEKTGLDLASMDEDAIRAEAKKLGFKHAIAPRTIKNPFVIPAKDLRETLIRYVK